MQYGHTNNRHRLWEVQIMINPNKSKYVRTTWMCMPRHLRTSQNEICMSKIVRRNS